MRAEVLKLCLTLRVLIVLLAVMIVVGALYGFSQELREM